MNKNINTISNVKNFFQLKKTPSRFYKSYTSHKLAAVAVAIILVVTIFASCRTVPEQKPEPETPQKPELSRNLLAQGQLSADQLAAFFLSRNPNEDRAHITQFAQYYIDEASAEGINSDAAFAQMCLETGYLRFGGLVQPEFHNYCGLGAMDAEHPGEQFATEELGVRAHIQHLQAYATKEETQLHKELVDPRYNWVHKTKYIETIFELTGNWATDPHYGEKIDSLLTAMEEFRY